MQNVAEDDRQVSQSGKPLCTGASLWAVPKLARGLRPLEPWHVNCVIIPTKCSLDISLEYILIDLDSVQHLPKGNIAFPLWNPLLICRTEGYARMYRNLIGRCQLTLPPQLCTKTRWTSREKQEQVKRGK